MENDLVSHTASTMRFEEILSNKFIKFVRGAAGMELS
jgi:hypothetical protein